MQKKCNLLSLTCESNLLLKTKCKQNIVSILGLKILIVPKMVICSWGGTCCKGEAETKISGKHRFCKEETMLLNNLLIFIFYIKTNTEKFEIKIYVISFFVAAVVVRYLTRRYIGEYSSTSGECLLEIL